MLQVFDFVQDEWKLLKTLCGRELPSPINATSNHVKVLFRSNDAVVSDGFKARWNQNCGGTITSESGVILSPGYPGPYKSSLNCTYIINHGGDNTNINFTFFSLEPSKTKLYFILCASILIIFIKDKNWFYERNV